jgi:hypothetical protein
MAIAWLQRRTAGSGELRRRTATPATNGTSDERGELEREASSGRKEKGESSAAFYRELEGEKALGEGETVGNGAIDASVSWRVMVGERNRSSDAPLTQRRTGADLLGWAARLLGSWLSGARSDVQGTRRTNWQLGSRASDADGASVARRRGHRGAQGLRARRAWALGAGARGLGWRARCRGRYVQGRLGRAAWPRRSSWGRYGSLGCWRLAQEGESKGRERT